MAAVLSTALAAQPLFGAAAFRSGQAARPLAFRDFKIVMQYLFKLILNGLWLSLLVAAPVQAATSSLSIGEIRGIAGKCLDIEPRRTEGGAKVFIWDCNGSKSQQWMIIPISGEIRAASGKCLDVPNANPSDYTKLQMWACNASNAQQWRYVDGEIRGLAGKCVDVDNAETANGTPVQLMECNSTNAQSWVMPR